MQEELRRIRAKDYSQLDQRLFDNMTKADNLSSALYQLSDFQKFLMEQIATLSKEEQTSRISRINTSIVQNIDELKHSILKCSSARPTVSAALRQKVALLRAQLQTAKKDIRGEIRKAVQTVTELAQDQLTQVISQLEQERKAHGLLLKKYALLEAEKGELVKLTEELRGRLAPPQQHCPTPLTHPLPQNESALPPPASPHPLPSLTYHTPLKEAPLNIGSVFPFHLAQHIKQEDWKIVRQKLSSGPEDKRESHEPREGSRGNSLKRQPSNHEISRKPSMALLQKQNEANALRSKGVEVRGRSKQKIKLCSMF